MTGLELGEFALSPGPLRKCSEPYSKYTVDIYTNWQQTATARSTKGVYTVRQTSSVPLSVAVHKTTHFQVCSLQF